MKAFVLACIAAVAVEANPLTAALDFWNSLPVTKADALAKYGKAKHIEMNPTHRQALAQAHHNVRATRERLGLPLLGSDLLGKQEGYDSFESMEGFNGKVLGFMKGLQYNQAAGPGLCFNTVESTLYASSNLFFVLSKMYMPWYLPEVQLIIQDNIALFGGFYHDCDMNKFFDSMTAVISQEGMSALATRAMVASKFEYKAYKDLKEQKGPKKATNFQKSAAFGKAFGAITQYSL